MIREKPPRCPVSPGTKLVIACPSPVAGVVAVLRSTAGFALEDPTRRSLAGTDRAREEITRASDRLAETLFTRLFTRNGEDSSRRPIRP
jgi:hypothetical protein